MNMVSNDKKSLSLEYVTTEILMFKWDSDDELRGPDATDITNLLISISKDLATSGSHYELNIESCHPLPSLKGYYFKELDSYLYALENEELLIKTSDIGTRLTPRGRMFLEKKRKNFYEELSEEERKEINTLENVIRHRIFDFYGNQARKKAKERRLKDGLPTTIIEKVIELKDAIVQLSQHLNSQDIYVTKCLDICDIIEKCPRNGIKYMLDSNLTHFISTLSEELENYNGIFKGEAEFEPYYKILDAVISSRRDIPDELYEDYYNNHIRL